MTEVNISDIEALADFRLHLAEFNKNLSESFKTMRTHWRELGEVWRDDMYVRFGEALEEVTPGIDSYLSATEGHEAYLLALVERLRAVRELSAGCRTWPTSMRTSRRSRSSPARSPGTGTPSAR